MKNATHAYTSHLAHSQFFNSEFFILNSPTQADRSPPGVIACMFDEPDVVIPLRMTPRWYIRPPSPLSMRNPIATLALRVAVILLTARGAIASPPRATFHHLTPENGLSHPSVYGVAQDRAGFLWFTTQDGVSRYDGYRFKVFQHDPSNPASLAENDSSPMVVDDDGSIWIGTWGGGLDRFDPATETFQHFRKSANDPRSLKDDRIQVLLRDRRGAIWVGT